MKVILRSEAKALNLKHYFTGEKCKNNHVTFRFVSDGKCNGCATERNKTYHLKNRAKRNAKMKIYIANNPLKNVENARRFREKQKKNNPFWDDIRAELQRKYRREDPLNSEKMKIYNADRYANNAEYRISCLIRQYVHRTFKMSGNVKTSKTFDVLGYTSSDLKSHLESLFTDGMSWSNHGEWHIDHIIPLSLMVKYGITEPHLVNALDNLQPLWARDNRVKGNRFVG